jgi:hypothetical protein
LVKQLSNTTPQGEILKYYTVIEGLKNKGNGYKKGISQEYRGFKNGL